MKGRVWQLSLTGFRGATTPLNLDIDPTKPVVVIFGENGTGKSTIVDAIDFVTNGGVGQLAGRQSTPVKEFLPALGAEAGTLGVELKVDSSTWRAHLSGVRPVLTPAGGPRPVAHVLRRARILELLAAKPGDRYGQLARFIDVPNVDKAETTLRQAAKETKRDLDSATDALGRSEAQIRGYWEAEGRPGSSADAWARELAARDPLALEKASKEVDHLLDLHQRAMVEMSRVTEATATAKDAAAKVGVAREQLREKERESAEAEALLLELLEKAETYLEAHPSLAACPVCGQPVDRAELAACLRQRRDAGAAVDSARRKVEAAVLAEAGARTALTAARMDAWRVGAKLSAAAQASRLKTIIGLRIEWPSFASLDQVVDADGAETAARQVGALAAALGAAVTPLRDGSERAKADVVRMRAVRTLVDTLDESTKAAKEAELLFGRLEQAQRIVESRRKVFVDGVLAAISQRVCDLYAKIHPGEELGDIALATDPNPKKRASLDITARFNEVCDVPPEGYYSESHLDTLGICVFLALAERSRAEGRVNLLVLDDVLTSVDGPHLDRFLSLVHDEAAEFDQVLLTTHYRYWFEAYRRGRGPAGKTCLIELSGWSMETGIRAARSTVEADRLAEALTSKPFDRQTVANRAGVILETVLAHVSLCYKLRLPASKDRHHNLGELLDAVPKELLPELIATFDNNTGAPTATALGPIIKALKALVPFRNWIGAHYNVLGDEVPDSQVLELGRKVLEIARAVACASCGELAGKRAGTHWRCRCSMTRLTPLALVGVEPPSEDVIP